MYRVQIREGINLELMQGDITSQADMDAIVNAANAWLRSGGGVAGAIHQAAGPELELEATKLGPIKPGEAVVTQAYNLPNRHVIHTLGPVYGRDLPHEQLLSDCYIHALEIAEHARLKSIAFPAISTGIFGYPVMEAAGIALQTIWQQAQKLHHVQTIRMVLFGENDYQTHVHVLEQLLNS